VITSLLNLQSKRIPDLVTRELFKNSQHRINSIAIIHEMLYRSEDIGRIDFKEYVENLVNTLIISFRGSENNVSVLLEMEETYLVMDLAIPLGLIVNEVVTNSLKYGLHEKGILVVQLQKNEDDFELHLRDNGPGVDVKNLGDSKKLGLRMVDYLIQQIEGTYEILPNSDGAHIKLTFNSHLNK
jgi:two-component sensor histidine kinase